MIKKIIDIIKYPVVKLLEHYKFKKRMKELKQRDPFIYK
jgi:hypothetical protein